MPFEYSIIECRSIRTIQLKSCQLKLQLSKAVVEATVFILIIPLKDCQSKLSLQCLLSKVVLAQLTSSRSKRYAPWSSIKGQPRILVHRRVTKSPNSSLSASKEGSASLSARYTLSCYYSSSVPNLCEGSDIALSHTTKAINKDVALLV